MMYKSFVLSSSILETHVETRLIPHYTVNIVMKDVNGMDFESRQYIEMVDDGFHTRLVTDSVGHYTGKYLAGPYAFYCLWRYATCGFGQRHHPLFPIELGGCSTSEVPVLARRKTGLSANYEYGY